MVNFIRLLVLLNLFFFSEASVFADPSLPEPVGRVVWINGKLTAIMPNKEERILQKTSVIYLQDTLKTDGNTTAQIVFTDNTLMAFKPNSNFKINEYKYNPKGKGQSVGKYVTTLFEGGFRTITGAIAKKNPDNYKVNTPVATIGVRGTDYSVALLHGELYVAYHEGKPCVTAGGKTVCLDGISPYVSVPSANSTPQSSKNQPAVFKEKLEITPAKIDPFVSSEGAIPVGGTVNSFCISQ